MSEQSYPPPPSPAQSWTEFPPPPPPVASSAPTSDERTFALLIHLSMLISAFLGPLVLWLVKKDSSTFVDHHGKEAINFQITTFVVSCALGVLMCVPVVNLLAFAAFFAVWAGHLACLVIAALKANEGVRWRYPVSIRLIT